MLDKICNLNLNFENLSKANDSVVLQRALQGEQSIIDIENCGTAMRFLTAYFAFSNQTVLLTGDTRMQQRPIKPLVDALLSMGANIQYQDKIGFPPLKIMGSKCTNTNIQINASISSQYITALMLIAPMLPNVLVITVSRVIRPAIYLA
jgi:3-phosphoshikimate 1-carboxyvinyltransferase